MKRGLFKKVSIFSVFCVMIFSALFFTACDGENYSKADVDSVYSAILDDYCDSEGYINIDINASKVVQTEAVSDDKYYIFPYILDKFVSYSSGIVFSVASRKNGILFSLGDFSQDELNDIYAKFGAVLSSLKSLDEVKTIYENSNGYLQYHELINSYFNLIDKLYSLSGVFSNYYFEPLYSSDFEASNATKGALSDVSWFELYTLSKVSYNYDLKNYVVDESEGAVTTWFNNSSVFKNFANDTGELLTALLTNSDLSYGVSSANKTSLAEIVSNMLGLKSTFERDFNNYILASEGTFFEEYLLATNKTSYLENCSIFERSKINLINEFILGTYEGFMSAMRLSIYYMNV